MTVELIIFYATTPVVGCISIHSEEFKVIVTVNNIIIEQSLSYSLNTVLNFFFSVFSFTMTHYYIYVCK